jgi:hypothetical protein
VGSGNGRSVVLAVGGRGPGVGGGVVYRVCAAPARFGASVERETTDPREAYAKAYAALPRSKGIAYEDGWLGTEDTLSDSEGDSRACTRLRG